ncbi:MAG TPA: DUF1801 domain-containing protein [Acidimicrobiia bacterium]
MERTDTDPDQFIDSLAPETGDDMRRLDHLISEVMADETRTLWEGVFWGGSDQTIIGYGDFSSTDSKGKTVDWFKVGLAAQKRHLSLYVNAADTDGYLVTRYANRLGRVKTGSASISFKSADDIDLDVLRELIQAAKAQMG